MFINEISNEFQQKLEEEYESDSFLKETEKSITKPNIIIFPTIKISNDNSIFDHCDFNQLFEDNFPPLCNKMIRSKSITFYKYGKRDYNSIVSENEKLKNDYETIIVENKKLKSDYDSIVKEIQKLKNDFESLIRENEKKLTQLKSDYDSIVKENQKLKDDHESLKRENEDIKKDNERIIIEKNNFLKKKEKIQSESNVLKEANIQYKNEIENLKNLIKEKNVNESINKSSSLDIDFYSNKIYRINSTMTLSAKDVRKSNEENIIKLQKPIEKNQCSNFQFSIIRKKENELSQIKNDFYKNIEESDKNKKKEELPKIEGENKEECLIPCENGNNYEKGKVFRGKNLI